MRLIDADELLEHVGRDRLDSRERIAQMIKNAPTVCDIDTISRRAVLEIAKQHTLTNDYLAIQNLPSVRPQEQTGKWKFVCQHWRKCSECGFSHKFAEDWNYCPNCGARMESEDKE